MQQKQVMHGQHMPSASRGRPPLPPSGPPMDGEIQANQKKSKVPVLEKHLVDQISKEEQNSLNSRFQEAMEADKKVNICLILFSCFLKIDFLNLLYVGYLILIYQKSDKHFTSLKRTWYWDESIPIICFLTIMLL